MAKAGRSGTSRGRLVFALNGATAVGLVAVIAALALALSPPAPPGIAAFAPTATKPITKAPPGQSSINGSGAGACAAGQVCTGPSAGPSAAATRALPSATPAAKGVPSALQCYTWPDGSVTQTFDPQSPPCVASWPEAAKGNGGATTQGVTATEVRVAVPVAQADSQFKRFQLIAQFFNTHFQLYGRRLVLVPFNSQQVAGTDTNYSDPGLQKADAEGIGALKPFAAVDFLDGQKGIYTIPLPEYLDTLARHRIISSVGGNLPPNSTGLDGHAPYQWTYLPTLPSIFDAVAGLTCRQLVGRPADHSPTYATTTRKFALVMSDPSEAGGGYPGLPKLLRQLAGCGVKNPRVIYFKSTDSSQSPIMTQLRSEGVTTLLYLPQSAIGPGTPQAGAQNVGYFPEWVLFSGNPTIVVNLLSGPKAQTQNTFGIASWDKVLSPATQPWREAFLQMGGTSTDYIRGGKALYNELQLLASGIQMAGPHLTPQTFAEALRATQFPNPGARTVPAYQPRVDYQAGSHELVRDFAGYWFDDAASYHDLEAGYLHQDYEVSNAFCWVDQGLRWEPAATPTVDHFRQGRCR